MPVLRSFTVEQSGYNPIKLFFNKQYLLLCVRVANRIDLSDYYTESILRDYELAILGWVGFEYDKSQLNSPESRELPPPTEVVNSFPADAKIKYVITYLEF